MPGQTIFVGTEYGVFVTDDGGASWSINNSGMANEADQLAAPVFDLKQQTRQELAWGDVSNYGEIYAASHGRGLFTTQSLHGCTDQMACNFWRGATIDDGTCEYNSCKGCLDTESCNYNPLAIQLVVCDYSCYGCTDSDAINYDANSLFDDGSCLATFLSCEQALTQNWSGFGFGLVAGDTSTWNLGEEDFWYTAFYLPDSLELNDNNTSATLPTVSFEIHEIIGLPEGLELQGINGNPGESVCWVIEGTPMQSGIFDVEVSGDIILNQGPSD